MNAKDRKELVDELGLIKANMAILKTDEAKLRIQLLRTGVAITEGQLFRACVVDANRADVDWKAIAVACKPSRQLVSAHTKHSVVTSVRVTARVGVAA